MSPIPDPRDSWPYRHQELPDEAADHPFVDDSDSDWFSKYSTIERNLVGHLLAPEREPVVSASRTPLIPRVVGGSAVVLAVLAAIIVSSGGNVRPPVAAPQRRAAITMIFVPHGSALWSSTFLKKRVGKTDDRHVVASQATAAIGAPGVMDKLAEAHPSATVAAKKVAARPTAVPRQTAGVEPSLALASQATRAARIASSTPPEADRVAPKVGSSNEFTNAVPNSLAAARPGWPPRVISEQSGRQADAAPPAKSSSESLVNSLPSGNSIHLEIFYGSQNAEAARSVAVLLRSDVAGIDSLNIRAGDAKTSVIAYFFPSDRAGATAIAASLRQRARQLVPVELLRRFPQPRPGTVEIFVPGHHVKELSDAG